MHGLAGDIAEDGQRILAHQQADHHDDGDTAEAEALAATEAHATTAAATGIHYVVAASCFLPAHVPLLQSVEG